MEFSPELLVIVREFERVAVLDPKESEDSLTSLAERAHRTLSDTELGVMYTRMLTRPKPHTWADDAIKLRTLGLDIMRSWAVNQHPFKRADKYDKRGRITREARIKEINALSALLGAALANSDDE